MYLLISGTARNSHTLNHIRSYPLGKIWKNPVWMIWMSCHSGSDRAWHTEACGAREFHHQRERPIRPWCPACPQLAAQCLERNHVGSVAFLSWPPKYTHLEKNLRSWTLQAKIVQFTISTQHAAQHFNNIPTACATACRNPGITTRLWSLQPCITHLANGGRGTVDVLSTFRSRV